MNELLRGICIDLRNAHLYGTSGREMGRETGLSPTTIKKFAHRDTTPSLRTVLVLADYAGHVVEISRRRHSFRLVK